MAAAQYAKKTVTSPVDPAQIAAAEREMLVPFERKDGESPYALHRDLQQIMQALVGIFRTEEDLQSALGKIEELRKRSENLSVDGSRMFNPGWHLARDLRSMLTVSCAVAQSALARRESRGAHSRIDFPNYDAIWGKQNNLISKQGDTMNLRQVPTAELPDELKPLIEEKK
jgi:succinate dehydrogenase / fumarate reductase flavoprotein subunit